MKHPFLWLPWVLAVLLSGCKPSEQTSSNEIIIGEYGSLTGSTATFGQSTHKGVELAVEEINTRNGVLDRNVRVIVEDDQGKPEQATSAVLKLIQRDRVVAILGEVASSRSIAAAPICQQNKIPMITPASTNPSVTEKGDYIFRTCFIDPFQGAVMAKFAFSNLNVKRAAVLTDRKNDYSVGLAQFFKEKFKELGGTIVAEESYQADDKEFKPQLTNLRAASPEAVFVPGYYTDCTLIARQARELGIKVPLLGGDGWDSEVTLKNGGTAIEGCYFSTHYHQDDPRPEVQGFVAKFKQKYNESPDSMAVLGYDAANILFQAIETAGSTDAAAIRDALAKTRDFPGVTGKITIDANRNAQKGAVVLKIENGKFNFFQLVAP